MLSEEARGADFSTTASFFKSHVLPVLNKNCLSCHGAIKKKAKLDLRTPEAIFRGGKNGPAVVPGKPGESPLIPFVHPHGDPHMPPGKSQLSPEELSVLEAWILRLGGATDTTAWAKRRKSRASGGELPDWLPPPGVSPTSVIDLLVETRWREKNVQPSESCDDATFVRRSYLDLVGRIPAPEEAADFLADTSSRKRAGLVDRLIASKEHARHLREVFDVVLLGRPKNLASADRSSHGWHAYLERAFHENRPWNEVLTEIIDARSESEASRGSFWFLYERKNKHQEIAKKAAPALFGVQMDCAQCHDHPVAPEILQEHYWGLVAFFSRSSNIDTKRGPAVAESAIGGFSKYADLAGENHDAVLSFFTGACIDEKFPKEGEKEVDQPANYEIAPPKKGQKAERPALPKFSRRRKLIEVAIEKSDLPARALVNRVWALLLGRGLVHPIDKMDSTHPPSHPALLEWLTRDFAASGYDVRRLIRAIALSRPYALDVTPSESSNETNPTDDLFARALEKPLTAESLHRSLLVASGRFDPKRTERAPDGLVSLFPNVFHEEYNASLKQALFLSNNPLVDGLVGREKGNTVDDLLAIEDHRMRVETLFSRVFLRSPDEEELERSLAYLKARSDRAEDACEQLLWALLTSAEFRFNH